MATAARGGTPPRLAEQLLLPGLIPTLGTKMPTAAAPAPSGDEVDAVKKATESTEKDKVGTNLICSLIVGINEAMKF